MSGSTSKSPESGAQGASAAAISAHYDVGDDFFRLWLDDTLTYSCGLWENADSLESAQIQKLDFHIASAKARGDVLVLDIGCGWGSLLQRLVESDKQVRAVGLTLSESQAKYVESMGLPRAKVKLESWRDHVPDGPYDAIISIGALEHFVRPSDTSDERIHAYRQFFRHCHAWLRPGSWMSLQTIAYGVGGFVRGAISDIFPESDLPRLFEIAKGAEGFFEISKLRNDREDYARTCRAWSERLSARDAQAREIAGAAVVQHYRAYLSAAARGFDLGVFVLYRIGLRRVDDRLARMAETS